MVDYEKLYLKLFNEITKVINTLEEAKEQTFKDFVRSEPSKDEAARFTGALETETYKTNGLE